METAAGAHVLVGLKGVRALLVGSKGVRAKQFQLILKGNKGTYI